MNQWPHPTSACFKDRYTMNQWPHSTSVCFLSCFKDTQETSPHKCLISELLQRHTQSTTDLTPQVSVFCAISKATACQPSVAEPGWGPMSARASKWAVDARSHKLDLAQHKEGNVARCLWPVMRGGLHFNVGCEVLQDIQHPAFKETKKYVNTFFKKIYFTLFMHACKHIPSKLYNTHTCMQGNHAALMCTNFLGAWLSV